MRISDNRWCTRAVCAEQLAEQLDVSQQTVSNRLRKMGKIQMFYRWVPYESNDSEMEKRKTHVKLGSFGTKGSRFCILAYSIVQGMKSKFILRIRGAKITSRPRRTIHIDRKTESLW